MMLTVHMICNGSKRNHSGLVFGIAINLSCVSLQKTKQFEIRDIDINIIYNLVSRLITLTALRHVYIRLLLVNCLVTEGVPGARTVLNCIQAS